MSTFQVSVNAEGILLLTGELNYAAITAELWEQSKALLAAAPTPIRIDLSGVTHSDSTGVAFLVGWVRQAKKLKKNINNTEKILKIR